MSEFSTEECKRKLVELYPETQAKLWKRVRKYKNEAGQWEREFIYPKPDIRTILQEKDNTLIEIQPSLVLETNSDLPRILFGSQGVPEVLSIVYQNANPAEEKFLTVLEKTIDWDSAEKNRSTYDFSKNIDFNQFVFNCHKHNINLAQSYMSYIETQLSFFSDLDETELPFHLNSREFDDSLPDMLEVLDKIKSGYQANVIMPVISAEMIQNVFRTMESVKDFLQFNEDEEAVEQAYENLKFLGRILKGGKPKPR